MAVETWGQLPKSQTDPETIEEAIQRYIQQHNEDETAHQGPGQSLDLHKSSDIIDHLIESVIRDKVAKFAISFDKLAGDRINVIDYYIDPNIWYWDCDEGGGIDPEPFNTVIYTAPGTGNKISVELINWGPYFFNSTNGDIVFQIGIIWRSKTYQEQYITVGSLIELAGCFGFKVFDNALYSYTDAYRMEGGEEKQEEKAEHILNIEVDKVYILRAHYKADEQKFYFYVNQQLKSIHNYYLWSDMTLETLFQILIRSRSYLSKSIIVLDFFFSCPR